MELTFPDVKNNAGRAPPPQGQGGEPGSRRSKNNTEVARIILRVMSDGSDVDSIQAILSSDASVQDAGFVPPSWENLALGVAEEVQDRDGEVEPNQPTKGWQSWAARAVESRRLHAIREALPSPQQALLRSQRELASGSGFQC